MTRGTKGAICAAASGTIPALNTASNDIGIPYDLVRSRPKQPLALPITVTRLDVLNSLHKR